MLPSEFTRRHLSLCAGRTRVCVAFVYSVCSGVVRDVEVHGEVRVCVCRNYTFGDFADRPPGVEQKEDGSLGRLREYRALLAATQSIESAAAVRTSEDLVAYWMLETNRRAAAMAVGKAGIFRQEESSSSLFWRSRDADAAAAAAAAADADAAAIARWRKRACVSGVYGKYVYLAEGEERDVEKCSMPVTSPMRRLCDLFNQVSMLSALARDTQNERSQMFVESCVSRVGEVLEGMRQIHRVELYSKILSRCWSWCVSDEDTVQTVRGIEFDMCESGDFADRPQGVKQNGDFADRPQGVKQNGDFADRPQGVKQNGDFADQPQGVKQNECMVYLPSLCLFTRVEILQSDHRALARSTSRASALNIDECSMERERSKMMQNEYRVFVFKDKLRLHRQVKVAPLLGE